MHCVYIRTPYSLRSMVTKLLDYAFITYPREYAVLQYNGYYRQI